MKKKIYFIISSILQIVGALYIMLNASAIIQSQLETISETYAMFPADFQQEMVSMLENSGEGMLIFYSVLQVILNLFIIKIVTKDSILRKKGKLIGLSLLCFFTAESTIGSLLSIINIIVLAFSKRRNPEDYPTKEKKPIPTIGYGTPSKKEIIFGIILILVYFSDYLWGGLIPEDISQTAAIAITIVFYILVLIVAILCFKDRLKRDIKLLRENAKAYRQYVLPKLGIMYIIYLICNLICIVISQQAQSVNQSTIEAIPLWFTIPVAVLWAPIVEELIFRGVLRRFIKNDKLFIITSAVIFGLLHTIAEATVLNMIILAIPYAILGGFFAYLYAKTNNITTNILAHAFNNAIAMLLSIATAAIIL